MCTSITTHPLLAQYAGYSAGPFCHGALKHDISTLFATFFVWTSLQFILCNYHLGMLSTCYAYLN